MDELRQLLDDREENDEPESRTQSQDNTSGEASNAGSSDAANSSESGSTDASGEEGDDAGTGAGTAKPYRKQRNYLDTTGLEVPPGFPDAVHQILVELSNINIQRFPNAAMDLLRTFLEKTIKAYADSVNEDIRSAANAQGYVYLAHCLLWLEDYLKRTGQWPFIQVVVKIRNGKINGYVASMDHLNAVNHNHQIFATTDDVRDGWSVMKGVMGMMLKP